jgi:phage-related minor tail protein
MSNGIDFVIGGKDQAKPAMSSVEKSLTRLEQKTDSLKKSTLSLSKVTGALAAAYVAVKAGVALLGGLDKVNAAYDQQVAGVEGLEVALKLQGVAVDVESKRLQAFASDMQKLTGVGDEVTLGLMRQAAMLGVDADQLDDAAKAAIGLSEATGKGLEESLMLVQKGLEGDLNAFGEVIPAIRTMKTEEEKLAAVLALSQRGLEAKAEASNTVAGMSERASGAVGDLMESVGALLAPVRMLISSGIKVLAESFPHMLRGSEKTSSTLFETG